MTHIRTLARPLFDPADFDIPPDVAHVCAGGETPPLRRHAEAFARYAADKGRGMPGRTAQEQAIETVRQHLAAHWAVGPEEIGLVGNVAEGVSMLVESLEWREGDNICLDVNEYPSVVAPFALRHGRYGPEVRFAVGQEADRIARLVDARTRVVAVSYVSYLNGERHDLAALRRAADSVGAMLVVDFTQAAGYLPIPAPIADFAFSASYKWLLGITGVAAAYWNRARQPDWAPGTAGWHSLATDARPDYRSGLVLRNDALRFTRGNPSHASVYVLAEALGYLSAFGMDAVQRHVQALTTDLHARLLAAGITPSTPADPARHGASICVETGRGQQVVDALHDRGVYAWNGRGRVRFSFHGYNSTGDVDRIVQELLPIWDRHAAA